MTTEELEAKWRAEFEAIDDVKERDWMLYYVACTKRHAEAEALRGTFESCNRARANAEQECEALRTENARLKEALAFVDTIKNTHKCGYCNGDGRVIDTRYTSGHGTCPKCWGSGIAPNLSYVAAQAALRGAGGRTMNHWTTHAGLDMAEWERGEDANIPT